MMTEAQFTSLHGGASLPLRILEMIAQARRHAETGRKVDLEVMCFAFTDQRIADALTTLCLTHPAITLRIIADWSQSARGSPGVLAAMADTGLRNLFIKFKLDAPYLHDDQGRLRYSYGASLGMLHHKSLMIRIDGEPRWLALGSYNWTARGQQAYENLILTEERKILEPMAAEFATLWSCHMLTGTTGRARQIMARLKDEAARGRDLRDPRLLCDILGVDTAGPAVMPLPRRRVTGDVVIAFSGSLPAGQTPGAGHAPPNDRRALDLLRPSGTRRPAPLTLNTLALEAIRSVPSGATLKLAMYALSSRVPEFGALIEAARRGVKVQMILDGTIGARSAQLIGGFAQRESLPLSVQITRRRMHQKYLCCPETGMVLSGTANMTEDATSRHSDHRILWRSNPTLAHAFATDFNTMSGRLSAEFVRAA